MCQSCLTLCDPMGYSLPGSSVKNTRVCSNSCPLSQWCYLTISSSVTLLSFFPSISPNIREFSNESALHTRWPKYWSFSFSSPSYECSRLISLRIDWFDLLAVQGTLKSLNQPHNLKASFPQCSTFFMDQLSQKSTNIYVWNIFLYFTHRGRLSF